MAKQLNITVSDWVYDEIEKRKKNNRSEYVEELIIKGLHREQ